MDLGRGRVARAEFRALRGDEPDGGGAAPSVVLGARPALGCRGAVTGNPEADVPRARRGIALAMPAPAVGGWAD